MSVGRADVGVEGTGVSVGNTGVSVGGTGVGVDGIGVSVGSTGVSVGGTGVGVGGTGVSVAGPGVTVGHGVSVGHDCAPTGANWSDATTSKVTVSKMTRLKNRIAILPLTSKIDGLPLPPSIV